MANPQFVKEFEALEKECLKRDGTPKGNASKKDLNRMEELKEILAKDVSDNYPVVLTGKQKKTFPKSINVCGNTIPVDDRGNTIGEVDPRRRREIFRKRQQAKRLGIDEERV